MTVKDHSLDTQDYGFTALSKIVRYWREQDGPEGKQHYLFWQNLRNQLYSKEPLDVVRSGD